MRQFDRRQFLSGLGVTLALPWLESSAMAAAPWPKRLAKRLGLKLAPFRFTFRCA